MRWALLIVLLVHCIAADIAECLNSTEDDSSNHTQFLSFEEWKKRKTETQLKIDSEIPSPMGEMEINVELFQSSDEPDVVKRVNYASYDCSATIVKTNSEAKGASALLNENKDSYLLNKCSADEKFIIIELCQDILVDSVVLANFEFFSSMFRTVRFSVADRYPTGSWKVLGEFEAANIRTAQTFDVKNPLIWAKFLKVEVLSVYDKEYYCPLSIIRVHGKTMMDDIKDESKNGTATLFSKEELDSLNKECSVLLPTIAMEEFKNRLTQEDFCFESPIPKTEEPAAQDSIYKNIVKRLSLLESNATLSLLYIEEQSKLLSEAFMKMEARQQSKFDAMATAFNATMNSQLRSLNELYRYFEAEGNEALQAQKAKHEAFIKESIYAVSNVSSDISFQKKLALFNTLLIVGLLIYVVFTREIETEQPLDSPTGDTIMRRMHFTLSHKLRSPSNGSIDEKKSM